MLLTILLIILLLMFVGALPPLELHSYGWGPDWLLAVVIVLVAYLLWQNRKKLGG